MDTQSTINDVAASIPGVVADSFAPSDYVLAIRDCLLLERCGVKFIVTGSSPSFRELALTYCAITDKTAFTHAVNSNNVDACLDLLPSSLLPGEMTNVVMQAVKSAFKPVEDVQKKQMAALLNAADVAGGSPSLI